MIKTICYISDSTKPETLADLEALYLQAKANNHKYNITGILIYKNQNFLQVLEGEENAVNQTYIRISKDIRHKNIFEIINTNIEERIFQDYNFGFTIVDNKKGLQNLNDYLEWLKEAENRSANKVISIVENFITKK
ncbi:BLUF domain-containing protein [Aestuariivivens insulae]|uniref:BLUF domain-containing protein n=1 Tax=Aestuariivivens insulae TaxID=1621988 RepID=UPI001F580038|nr:BLUF domain-containing protein [Aestuariivivens insulae]